MLFIQTEGASRSADSAAAVLFIQTEDARRVLPRCCLSKLKVCRQEKKRKNLKVFERFCAGQLCADLLRGLFYCVISCIYSTSLLESHSDLDWESLSHLTFNSNNPSPTGILNSLPFEALSLAGRESWSHQDFLDLSSLIWTTFKIGSGRPCQLVRVSLFGP